MLSALVVSFPGQIATDRPAATMSPKTSRTFLVPYERGRKGFTMTNMNNNNATTTNTLTVRLPEIVGRHGWADWNQAVNSLAPDWVQAGTDGDGFPVWVPSDPGWYDLGGWD